MQHLFSAQFARALALLTLACPFAHADTDFDPLTLSLAEEEAVAAAGGPVTRRGVDLEGWLQHHAWRGGRLAPGTQAPESQARLALDFRRDWTLSPGWRATLSDRLESAQNLDAGRQTQTCNALREAFVSWRGDSTVPVPAQPTKEIAPEGEAFFVDMGRINQRLGVASGYNPTDWFRGGAVVSGVSQNPATLRQNRLGTVAVRGQWLSATQAWTLAWVPQLSNREHPDERDLATGLERTNRQQAVLVRWAPAINERVSLDLAALSRGGEIESGLNATALLGDSLLAGLELSSARRPWLPTVDSALSAVPPASQSALRLAAGASWTAESGITLTLERHYAADALSAPSWRDWQSALRQHGASGAAVNAVNAAYGRLTSDLAYRQDLLVRDMWFARTAWDDAFGWKGFNIAAFARRNAYDRSRSWQAEASWNDRQDWSLRCIVGGNAGRETSEFGGRAQRVYASLSLVFYR